MKATPSHEYFRADLLDPLPASEVQRRRLIKERLEKQYAQWRDQEQKRRAL
jgi:hypothetical protein